MKIKTANLIGAALDWAVAKCRGRGIEFDDPRDPWLTLDGIAHQPLHSYSPSTDWAQGGPIIEREHLEVSPTFSNTAWIAGYPNNPTSKQHWSNGPTPLISAMRCFVASKLGDEVEIPEELLK